MSNEIRRLAYKMFKVTGRDIDSISLVRMENNILYVETYGEYGVSDVTEYNIWDALALLEDNR